MIITISWLCTKHNIFFLITQMTYTRYFFSAKNRLDLGHVDTLLLCGTAPKSKMRVTFFPRIVIYTEKYL